MHAYLESYNCGSLLYSFHSVLYLVYAALRTPCHDVLIVLHRKGYVGSQDRTDCRLSDFISMCEAIHEAASDDCPIVWICASSMLPITMLT